MSPRHKGSTKRQIYGRTLQIKPQNSTPARITPDVLSRSRAIVEAYDGINSQPEPEPDYEEFRMYCNRMNFPVGSIYVTDDEDVNPYDILGIGQWVRVQSAYIRASDDHSGYIGSDNISFTATAGPLNTDYVSQTHSHSIAAFNTQSHTLTSNEIPQHTHPFQAGTYTWGWGSIVTGPDKIVTGANVDDNPSQVNPGTNDLMTRANFWPCNIALDNASTQDGHSHVVSAHDTGSFSTSHRHVIDQFNINVNGEHLHSSYKCFFWIRVQ